NVDCTKSPSRCTNRLRVGRLANGTTRCPTLAKSSPIVACCSALGRNDVEGWSELRPASTAGPSSKSLGRMRSELLAKALTRSQPQERRLALPDLELWQSIAQEGVRVFLLLAFWALGSAIVFFVVYAAALPAQPNRSETRAPRYGQVSRIRFFTREIRSRNQAGAPARCRRRSPDDSPVPLKGANVCLGREEAFMADLDRFASDGNISCFADQLRSLLQNSSNAANFPCV